MRLGLHLRYVGRILLAGAGGGDVASAIALSGSGLARSLEVGFISRSLNRGLHLLVVVLLLLLLQNAVAEFLTQAL